MGGGGGFNAIRDFRMAEPSLSAIPAKGASSPPGRKTRERRREPKKSCILRLGLKFGEGGVVGVSERNAIFEGRKEADGEFFKMMVSRCWTVYPNGYLFLTLNG
ncbi:hypothetical protein V8G54_028108, partial [Vigna mungo]